MGDGLEIERQQLFTRVAEGSTERVVDLEPASLQIDQRHANRSVAKCPLEQLALVDTRRDSKLGPVGGPGGVDQSSFHEPSHIFQRARHSPSMSYSGFCLVAAPVGKH